MISVREEAEFASLVLQERCPRWNADTLETSGQCDVEEFQGEIKVSAKVSTDGQQRYLIHQTIRIAKQNSKA